MMEAAGGTDVETSMGPGKTGGVQNGGARRDLFVS